MKDFTKILHRSAPRIDDACALRLTLWDPMRLALFKTKANASQGPHNEVYPTRFRDSWKIVQHVVK